MISYVIVMEECRWKLLKEYRYDVINLANIIVIVTISDSLKWQNIDIVAYIIHIKIYKRIISA